MQNKTVQQEGRSLSAAYESSKCIFTLHCYTRSHRARLVMIGPDLGPHSVKRRFSKNSVCVQRLVAAWVTPSPQGANAFFDDVTHMSITRKPNLSSATKRSRARCFGLIRSAVCRVQSLCVPCARARSRHSEQNDGVCGACGACYRAFSEPP